MSQLPTGTDIANLVNAKVITTQEAKEILFKLEEVSEAPVSGLKVGTNNREIEYVMEKNI